MSGKKNIESKKASSHSRGGFEVPETYFDDLNNRIMGNIRLREKKTTLSTWQLIRPQLILAASFIGLGILIYSGIHFILGGPQKNIVSPEYITELVELEVGNMSEAMLYELIETPSQNIPVDASMDDAIIEYLVNSKIDFETLINEL